MGRDFALALLLLFSAVPVGANVIGVDTQNFNPTNDGLDFVTVQSSKTLTPGLLNIGLFFNYAVNSLPNYEDKSTQSRTNFHDSLVSSDMNFGLGAARDWELGMSFPSVLAQSVKSDLNTYSGQFTTTGATEFRLMTKYRLLGERDSGLAGIFTINFNEIQNDPFIGINPGPTYNFELAADTSLGSGMAWAINAGYRLRHPGTQVPGIPVEPLGNQLIASTALSYLVTSWNTKLIGEIYGSYPAQKRQFISDRSASTAEALFGIKTDVTRSLAFHFGGGTEIVHGTSSADWRLYTGINWVVGPMFAKPKPAIMKVQTPVVAKQEAPPPSPEPVRKTLDLNDTSVDPFAGTPQPKEEFVVSDILFEFDKELIRPEFNDLLKRMVAYLLKPPAVKSLVIEGHTDSIGDPNYNLDLSQRRADNVRDTLVALGIPAAKISAKGFGEKKPIASNGNFQGRALNRRVEFKVQR